MFDTISPQIPQFLSSNYTTIDPFWLNRLTHIRKPEVDLELRLGQVGPTIFDQEAMRTKTNDKEVPMGRVSKNLALTLGHRRRGRPIGSGTRTKCRRSGNKKEARRCERCGPLLDIDLNKVKITDDDDDDDDESEGSIKKRKRDYYGPCVRCGMVFDISQRYASHMRIHYLMDETEEEKMVRLAKKRTR